MAIGEEDEDEDDDEGEEVDFIRFSVPQMARDISTKDNLVKVN